MKGAGGTSGGFLNFFIGLALAGVGFFMFFSRVTVQMHRSRFFGYDAGAGILVLFIIGVAMLFFNGKSVGGWVLTSASLVGLFLYLLLSLDFHFLQTNLTTLLVMLGLLGAGIGLVIRSLKSSNSRPGTEAE